MNGEIQSIESCVQAFYGMISGKMGDERDWAAFRNLFIADAVLSVCKMDDRGRGSVRSYAPEAYIEMLSAFLSGKDFFEYSMINDIQRYGNISCVCSEYAAYADFERQKFLKRGKNLIHLALDGENWKITSMLWEDGV